MKRYPSKLPDEIATMREIVKTGCSVSRFGDGEFKLAVGGDCVSQHADPELARRLREVLVEDVPGLMVCIPRCVGRWDVAKYDAKRYDFWERCSRRHEWTELLGELRYGSSFITRMDMAIHIHCAQYWNMVSSLWAGLDVVCVTGAKLNHESAIFKSAASVDVIHAPHRDAWRERDAIMAECMKRPKDRLFYLSMGATATILASDLCKAGRRALDMGAMSKYFLGGKAGHP